MKFFKFFFLIFLFLMICFSSYHLLETKGQYPNSYWLVIVSLVLLFAYFLRVILRIKLGGKYLSLEEEISQIQVEQEKLANITTALYKLISINFANDAHNPYPEMTERYKLISEELTKFFNEKEVLNFMDELILIQKKRK